MKMISDVLGKFRNMKIHCEIKRHTKFPLFNFQYTVDLIPQKIWMAATSQRKILIIQLPLLHVQSDYQRKGISSDNGCF